MKLLLILVLSGLSSVSFASEDVCDSLFVYESGQFKNSVSAEKARVISEFTLVADSYVKGALARQVMEMTGDFGTVSFDEAIEASDDKEITVIIAQNKKTRRLYTILQAFAGDTEFGKVFSLYSSSPVAELGDGECRSLK